MKKNDKKTLKINSSDLNISEVNHSFSSSESQIQKSEKNEKAKQSSQANVSENYHTLLPRYLQDSLKRAASSNTLNEFERQCEIDRVARSAKTEYPKGFRNDY